MQVEELRRRSTCETTVLSSLFTSSSHPDSDLRFPRHMDYFSSSQTILMNCSYSFSSTISEISLEIVGIIWGCWWHYVVCILGLWLVSCSTTGKILPATPLNTNHSIQMRDSSHNQVAAQQRNRNDSELFHCWRRADASASQHSQCPSTLAFSHMDMDQAESNIGRHLQLILLF